MCEHTARRPTPTPQGLNKTEAHALGLHYVPAPEDVQRLLLEHIERDWGAFCV